MAITKEFLKNLGIEAEATQKIFSKNAEVQRS